MHLAGGGTKVNAWRLAQARYPRSTELPVLAARRRLGPAQQIPRLAATAGDKMTQSKERKGAKGWRDGVRKDLFVNLRGGAWASHATSQGGLCETGSPDSRTLRRPIRPQCIPPRGRGVDHFSPPLYAKAHEGQDGCSWGIVYICAGVSATWQIYPGRACYGSGTGNLGANSLKDAGIECVCLCIRS
ncbi:hypothetical protein BX600DRAFT_21810 [Xylariales sp. PMI_506]|nr:hypothetical protein BX600DRAFT_21810 [Xylariales sp. PMI_506]